MKILVTGAHGQLGREVVRVLVERGNTVVGTGTGSEPGGPAAGAYTYRQLNLLEPDSIPVLLNEERPDAVIHCAAWTAVDAAQKPENAESVRVVNTDSVKVLAQCCETLKAKFMYISTDFVFGEGTDETDAPISADEDRREPFNYYGVTKRDGEILAEKYSSRCFIVRTAWVFGPDGKSFVSTMLDLAAEHDVISVVSDQVGRTSYTPDVAVLIADMIVTEAYGRYNVTNSGEYVSRYELAREIFRMAGIDVTVRPVSSEDYVTPAKRPRNSRLDCAKIQASGFELLPDWRDSIQRYLNLRMFRKSSQKA